MTQLEHSAPVCHSAAAQGTVSGPSSVVTVAEILGFLSSMRKSGTLCVETPKESFLVQLQEGAVVYAQGDLPQEGDLLGQILVQQGALTAEALEGALEEVHSGAAGRRTVLGAYLVRRELISAHALGRALARQAQGTFNRMFAAVDALWRFEASVRMIDTADMHLNVIQLLLESARVNDEHFQRLQCDVGIPIARLMADPDAP
jgi:hypothetical protein